MKPNELFCKMWDAPYKHETKYSGSWALWQENTILYVSFQQTVQKQDWKQNFKIWSKKLPLNGKSIKIHAGFYQQFYEVYPVVALALTDYLHCHKEIARVTFCGWSQGAVLASLCFRALTPVITKTRPELNVNCVLFGMPNFIKKESVADYNAAGDKAVEFRHQRDIFTYLPRRFSKPDNDTVTFGKRFFLPDAVINVRKYHTSYISCEGVDLDRFNF